MIDWSDVDPEAMFQQTTSEEVQQEANQRAQGKVVPTGEYRLIAVKVTPRTATPETDKYITPGRIIANVQFSVHAKGDPTGSKLATLFAIFSPTTERFNDRLDAPTQLALQAAKAFGYKATAGGWFKPTMEAVEQYPLIGYIRTTVKPDGAEKKISLDSQAQVDEYAGHETLRMNLYNIKGV